MSDVNNNKSRSIGWTGKYDGNKAKAAEVTTKAFMEIFDADKSGDLTREELSPGHFKFDQATFKKLAKDNKLSADELRAYAKQSFLPGNLAEMAEGYAGWVKDDLKEIQDYKNLGMIQKAKQAITDAWDFGPGYDREENLKDNLEFIKSRPAEMLQDQAKQD